jgi:hypothetical protein
MASELGQLSDYAMHVHSIMQDSDDFTFVIIEPVEDDVSRDQECMKSRAKFRSTSADCGSPPKTAKRRMQRGHVSALLTDAPAL